jgi:cyclophilin family peptidyl-prolyl cis-trans isomerase
VSKAKAPVRPGGTRHGAARHAPAAAEDYEEVALPEAWRRRPWTPFLIVGVLIAVVLASGLAIDQALKPAAPAALANCPTSTQVGTHTFLGRQPICILPDHKYQATVNTTQGQVVINLLASSAPVTVNNFVVLAVNGYYNGLSFWKSEDWVLQSGDPGGDGRGGPGYTLPEEGDAGLSWGLGAVGMARAPGGPINGSQFFIVKAAWPANGPTFGYNRFGTVVTGMDKAQLLTSTDRITSISIKVS